MTRVLGFVTIFLFCSPLRADDKEKTAGDIGNRDAGKGLNWYSLERQIAIGKGLAQQVEAQAKIVDDPVIVEYVNRVGQNLVRNSEAKVSFTIKVIDSEEVNAVGLPGGFLFVNSGLIRKANTEAELAGFMAHEIARESGRGHSAQLAVIPLMFMGTWPGYGVHPAAGVLFPLAFLSWPGVFETEADRLAVECLYKTGYDPEAFVDFFQRIKLREMKKSGVIARLFSMRPLTDERLAASRKNVQELPNARPGYIVTTPEFTEMKAHLALRHNRRDPDQQK
jgi:predicted Zn-dependent protease